MSLIRRPLGNVTILSAGLLILVAMGLVFLAAPLPGHADRSSAPQSADIRLVKDLLTTEQSGDLPYPWDSFVEFTEIGGVVVFHAWDGIHGRELWQTDGTAAGTRLLKDLCPGDCSSYPFEFRSALGHVYFHATTPDLGNAIWRTDGTAAGTVPVVDFSPGNSHYIRGTVNAPFTTEFQESLFFAADNGVSGTELWRSDGQPGGSSEQIADIVPGPESSWPASLFVVGDTLYFTSDDGIHGRELWKSDGTPAGTSMVDDLCPGPEDCLYWESLTSSSGPRIFARTGDTLILLAGERGYDWRLWASDGSAEGTRPLRDLEVHQLFPFPAIDGSVLLSAEIAFEGAELWRTDGTEAGTYLVKDIHPTSGSFPDALSTSGGVVYLSADDGVHGDELWRTDGTTAGTTLVADVRPGPESGVVGYFFPKVPEPTSVVAYFPGDDGVHGYEMWSTDGTPEGTQMLVDASPGAGSGVDRWTLSFPGELEDRLVFSTVNAIYRSRLWITDGFSPGTEDLGQINRQTSSMLRMNGLGAEPDIAPAGERVLYRADDGLTGPELFGSDGTGQGTVLVEDFCPPDCEGSSGGWPHLLTAVDDQVYFVAPLEEDLSLRVSDGTSKGTTIVDPDLRWDWFWDLTPWIAVNEPSRLLFVGTGGLHVTDGSPSGTFRLGVDSSDWWPTPAADRVYFSCGDDLCVSFGNPDEAQGVPGTGDSDPERLTALGKRVVYSADDGVHGREMWISDTTAAGTSMLLDINPGPTSSVIEDYWGGMTLAAGDRVFFPADDGTTGEELWQTDGTPAGTTRVADVNPGPASSEPRPWLVASSILFFTAWTAETGRELWTLDMQTGAVELLIDLDPGPGSGITERLIDIFAYRPRERPRLWNGRLYFAGSDGLHGVELWSTNGKASGTRLERDIHPGPGSSSPNGFTVWEDKLFFSASDGQTGWELWVVDPSGTVQQIFADDFESGDTSAWSESSP